VMQPVWLRGPRAPCTSRVPRLGIARLGPGLRRALNQLLTALVALVPTERSASQ